MDNNEPNDKDLELFYTWKGTFRKIFGRIIKDMSENTGLSESDYGVLGMLVEIGKGELPQQELSTLLDWTKSRLSHHLTRMEKRGLVLRESLGIGNGVKVVITHAGKLAFEASRPIVAMAIRKHFLDQLTKEDIELITKLAERTE